MMPSVGIGRSVVKVDQPGDAFESYALNQHTVQLAAQDLAAVLHNDQVVQRVGDRKHRVVAKGVVRRLVVAAVARASQWGARIAVVVLCEQVRLAGDVRLKIAPTRLCVAQRRKLPATRHVRAVCGRALPVARLHRQKALECAVVQGEIRNRHVRLYRCEGGEAGQPHVALAADPTFRRRVYEFPP
eukprot:2579516-Prymnesium_polylepis.1